jgi:hypothetical protein
MSNGESPGSIARIFVRGTGPREPPPAVPRPRDPGESAEPLRPGESAEPLPPSDADLIAACRAGDAAAYDTLYRRHVTAAHSLARPGGSGPHGGMDRTRSAILCVHSAPDHPSRGELLRRWDPLPSRRDHRRHPLSPSRIPSIRYPSCTRARHPRLVAAPRSASRPALAVLVVRRSTHEARAALAPGGVTH